MKSKAIAKLAASTLVVGASFTGGTAGIAQSSTNTSVGDFAAQAANAAKQALKALTKLKYDSAISFAETAVGYEPRDAGYRVLLGQTYLSAGRFHAAEQSFSDALTLDPERERAALNLALSQAALGKRAAARATLTDYRDKLPAADFGLALALAGDPEEAVRVLEFATRAPDANAKTRQNLAFAYALAGKWNNAKVMAVQDLSVEDADARIAQWAVLVRPAAPSDQVASVLGVKAGSDAGQPSRLALATPAAAPVQTAQAAPLPALAPAPAPVRAFVPAPVAAPVVAAVEPQPQPAFETAPVKMAEAAQPESVVPVAAVAPAPLIHREAGPARQAITTPAFVRQVAMIATPIRKAAPIVHANAQRPMIRPAVMVRPVASGKFVVQLGAFANKGNAERAWTKISAKYRLGGYNPISGFMKVSNTTFTRLAISGFATRNDATRVCERIKHGGGVCFVRVQEGDAPAQWVRRDQKPAIRVASR